MPTEPSPRFFQGRLRAVPFEAILFCLIWFTLGAFIKSTDLEAYNLQQMGVDAIVEHGTFALGLSTHPLLQPRGDVFEYQGKLLAAKQPGQFTWGALAYYPLHAFGLTYDRDYTLASAWVTWISATSFAALGAVVIFSLSFRIWRFGFWPSLLTALAFAFGTNVFPYSGVAHHDIIGGTFALIAFIAFEGGRLLREKRLWLVCGLASGLAIFTSMLPALIVLAILATGFVFAVLHRSLLYLLAGFALGSLPLALHNWKYFGSPLIQANNAGNYSDTFFHPSLAIFLPHLERYFGLGELSLWMYAPIAGFGLLSTFYLWRERKFRIPATLLIAMAIVHSAYILNIETHGHCQFGPRYLLPLMGFFVLPLAYVWERARKTSSLYRENGLELAIVADIFLGVSIVVNLVGALIGTMNCDLRQWLPAAYLKGTVVFGSAQYPLRTPMLAALGITFLITLLAAAVIGFLDHRHRQEIPR